MPARVKTLWQLRHPPATIIRDGFGRPDDATQIGRAETGHVPSALAGTWGVNGGKVYSVTDANWDLVLWDPGVPDYAIQADVSGTVASTSNYRLPDIICNYQSDGNFLGVTLYNGKCELYKESGWTYTTLANASLTLTDGLVYQIRLEAKRSTLRAFVNNKLWVSYTLTAAEYTAYKANTRCGFALEKVGAPATPARWDNLRVDRL